MADSKNAAPDQEFNDDGTKNPDYVKPTEGGEGGEGGTSDKKDDTGGEEKEEGGDEAKEFDDNAEPIVPERSSASHIIARKEKKIKKLESDAAPKEGEEGYVAPVEGEGDTAEETQTAVAAEVEKQTKPIIDKMVSDSDQNELNALFSSTPEAKKYEKHIKAYMSHDSWKGVPVAAIYHHLAFAHAQALGAKAKEAADVEANQNKGGGRTVKKDTTDTVDGLPSPEALAEMTDEELQKVQDDAIQGKYLKK